MSCNTTQTEFVLHAGGVEFFALDFTRKYFAGNGDTARNLVDFTVEANTDGFVATPATPGGASLSVGDPVPGGVVWFHCSGGVPGGEYSVSATIDTPLGRVKPWQVVVLCRALPAA